MVEKVKNYMQQKCMVQKDDKIIAGISGGPDSICLLCVLVDLKTEFGYELAAVHVNHMLRGEDADLDEQFVTDFCDKMQVPLNVVREDVKIYAEKYHLSTEEAGREVRRQAFDQTMKLYDGNKIALAHHMNDNAETVLFHLARGTGVKGAAGIQPVSGSCIRPLLCLKREEIEAYLKEKSIESCLDKTNLENLYTRNKIRNEIIPYFQKHINEKTVEHICAFTEQMRELKAFVDSSVHEKFDEIVDVKEDTYFLSVEELEKTDPALRPYLIREVIVRAAGREKDIESVHLRDVEELMRKQSGRQVDLPYGLRAFREYDDICIRKKEESEQKLFLELMESGEETEGFRRVIEIPERDVKLEIRVFCREKNWSSFEELPYTKWFDYDIIKNSIVLRTRQPGDCITINDCGQTQKLKKYFINNKIPEAKRDRILLLADGSHIMWIVGYRQSKKYQITDTTKKVLEIKIFNYGGKNNGRKY